MILTALFQKVCSQNFVSIVTVAKRISWKVYTPFKAYKTVVQKMRNLHCQNQNIPFVADFRRNGTIPGLFCFLQIKRLRVLNRRLLSVSRGVVNYINENLTLPNKPSPPGQRHIRSAPLKLQRRFKEMIFFRHFWQWFPLAFVAGW